MNRVLVISPHPDDEAIGCGGTICSLVHLDVAVKVLFITSGEKGGHGRAEDETCRTREEEARASAQILGVNAIEFYREPDGALRAHSRLVSRLHDDVVSWRPDRIYLPHDHEMHPDHRAVNRALRKALRSESASRLRADVLMYEIWTPIQFMDEIVDISPFIEQKRNAIRSHRSQCEIMAFDEAILGLNRYRGEMHSWPGGDFAEIFRRLRWR